MASDLKVQAPRWGVSLAGHEIDLMIWSDTLKPPFDPWVETRDLEHEPNVLFSERFADVESYENVREVAEPMIVELNGAMALTRSADPLKISAIIDFSHSTPRRHISITAEGVTLRSYASSPTLTVHRADGSIIPPPPPVPSRAQTCF